MSPRNVSVCLIVASAALACASDIWFKPGAGPDALAADKTACRRLAEAPDSAAGEAAATTPSERFESCMQARDWWHVIPGAGGDVALRDDQVIALEDDDTTYAPTTTADDAAVLPDVASRELQGERTEPSPVPATSATPSSGGALAPSGSNPAAAAPTAAPSTAARPGEASDPTARPTQKSVARTRAPRRADPARRQFWFKWGAGNGQLERDQAACRADLGLADDASSPSRWGEDPRFDACMRERGWTGGSIEAS